MPGPLHNRTFLVDRSFGSLQVAKALNAAAATYGFHVIPLDSLFPPDTEDIVWLEEAGRKNWIVLSRDQRIRTNYLERETLLAAGVAAFLVQGGNMNAQDTSFVLSNALRAIEVVIRLHPKPIIATISKKAAVTVHEDATGRLAKPKRYG